MKNFHITILSTILCLSLFATSNIEAARVALVIGNAAYPRLSETNIFAPLDNPQHDAEDMARALRSYGFEVDMLQNTDNRQMEKALNRFIRKLSDGDVGLFYYSGHGVQVANLNYLIPVGRNFADGSDVNYDALKANKILDKMTRANSGVNIMILDACRENLSLEQTKGFGESGFAAMEAAGAIISYAAKSGSVAYGDSRSRNSYYTHHLLQTMRQGGLSIEQVFKRTRSAVYKSTDGKQTPWENSGLMGDFCFGKCGVQPQHAKIAELLNACEQHFQANRLTTGRGGTALECYEQVLKLDPDNTEALNGLQEIEAKYVEWVQRAVQKGQKDKARQYLLSLRGVNPESPLLGDLEIQLVEQTTTATIISTDTPTPSPTISQKSPSIPKTEISLRHTPGKVLDSYGRQQFQLDKKSRPLKYIENDFEAKGNVVLDHTTGLMWQTPISGLMTYHKAIAYVKNLNKQGSVGYYDWRLPTIPELMSILEPEKSLHGLYINPIFGKELQWCWSSDTTPSGGVAWYVSFYGGHVGGVNIGTKSTGYVLLVRSWQR